MTRQQINNHSYSCDTQTEMNMEELAFKVSAIEKAYGHLFTVDSGLRSQSDQERINPSAPKSKHLTGQAVDVADPVGSLWSWIEQNMSLMAKIGVYFEDKGSTPTWVHIQCVPPGSGKRVFIP